MKIGGPADTDSSGSTSGTEAAESTVTVGDLRPVVSLHGASHSGPVDTALAAPLYSIPEQRRRGRSHTRDGSDGDVGWRRFGSPSPGPRRPASARSRSPNTIRIGTVDDARSVLSEASDSARAGRARPAVDDGACTLQTRVRVRPPELKAKDHRTIRNWLARIALGGVLAVGGGIGGFVGGGMLGTFFGGPLGAAIGGIGGGVLGATVGLMAGVALADSLFVQPQQAHLKAAVNAIQRDLRREFSEGERDHLEVVTDDQWRSLLHVPSSKGRYMPFKGSGAGARVKGHPQRQQIRRALVREVADAGLEAAQHRKATLIAEANLEELKRRAREAVTNDQLVNLLHVSESEVQDPTRRQMIGQELMREVADFGLAAAQRLKARLIAQANRNELE
jgi:hypothetical protein